VRPDQPDPDAPVRLPESEAAAAPIPPRTGAVVSQMTDA
jgi:hypothetical protein